jgi:hypothetical protein
VQPRPFCEEYFIAKKVAQNLVYKLLKLKPMPKVVNHPSGKNSPNLIYLFKSQSKLQLIAKNILAAVA